MYLRLRDPGVYARMLVEKVSVSGNGFKLSFSGVINPYGTRSLEPLRSINDMLASTGQRGRSDKQASQSSHMMFECRENALKALRQNRLPEKPDFEQWVKDGLAKY